MDDLGTVRVGSAVVTSRVCPGDGTTTVPLWNGKWQIDAAGEMVPHIIDMPVGKTHTNAMGVGYWLAKGYRMVNEVPRKDDGSYRIPENIKARMEIEARRAAVYVEEQVENLKQTKEKDTTTQLVDIMTKLVERIERLENATQLQPARTDSETVQGGVPQERAGAEPGSVGKDTRPRKNSRAKRGPKAGARDN
jgi:hypothetical protein